MALLGNIIGKTTHVNLLPPMFPTSPCLLPVMKIVALENE
jgi:hypothetical protein